MNLKLLQTAFIEQVVVDSNPSTGFYEQLKQCGTLSPARQIEIYQSNVRSALRDTLKQIFPVCLRIVGENYFSQIADRYIRKHPSTCSNLNAYGQHFSSFIQTLLTQRSELSDFPYLSDLAKLEQLYHDLYYVGNDTVFDFERFTALSEAQHQRLRFKLSNALKLMKTPFPVLAIWQVNRDLGTSVETIQMPKQEQTLAIFRQHFQVEIENISFERHQFLEAMVKGTTLSDLINQFESVDNFDTNHQLTELITKGWINGFEIADV